MSKIHLRGDDHIRFSVAVPKRDRALLDAVRSRYEKQIGSKLSFSVVLSLMLRDFTKTAE